MTELSTAMLQVALSIGFAVFISYAAGRAHQWYRHSLEREIAYRDGYDEASHSLFRLATRSSSVGETSGAIVREVGSVRSDTVWTTAAGVDREASTYRLTPRQESVTWASTAQSVEA
jgi:hypothetical protein